MTYFLLMTRHVSVAEAKAKAKAKAKAQLSALLSAVEGGDSVTITKHGRPVACLMPAPKRVVRQGGELLANPEWASFVPPPDLFAPMTDEELRAEGWR